ncbi:MAG: GtrA family protein [Candidatus Tagabacteria bacterium]
MKKKDFLMAGLAGFFTALFLFPTFKNARIAQIGYIYVGLIIGLPLLWMLALIVGRFLNRWLSWIYQFVKFCIIGLLNAALDFGVLNLLSLYTGLTSGFIIGGVNLPGFIVAATNSYFWNKFWVFAPASESLAGKGEKKTNYGDVITFIPVVVSGAVINSAIVIFISTYVHPLFGLSASQWLNISKLVASAIALVWNFIGFRLFVFKSKNN